MSTRKSIQKLNTTESPTKPTLPMSAATLSPQTTTSKLPLLQLDTKVSDTTTSTVASDDDVTTTTTTASTPTESTTTTTTVKSSPKTATTENDLIKTSDSEIIDTTINTATTSSSSITKEQQLSPITNTDLTLDTTKRSVGRRKNSVASSITSSSPTCSQQSNKKTSGHNSSSIASSNDDINNEELVGISGDISNENITTNELDDKKLPIIQNSNSGSGSSGEQKLNDDTNKLESPARVGRKKKVFNKSAIITRKSAATTPTTTKKKEESPVVAKPPINIRTSMRNRRNSTGKIVDTKQNEPKKGVSNKQTRKTLSSTPEPQQRTPIKRKREDSMKSDHDKDDQQPIDKIIKIEKNDDIEQQHADEEQMDINDNDDLNKLDDGEIKSHNDISTTNIKNEILVDDKNSIISGGDQIEVDESLTETTTKLDDSSTLLDAKTTDNNELNNSNKIAFPVFYTKARRGRPKNNQNIIDKTNLRPRRSDKIRIDTSLELPEIKRPKRRGRKCVDEITSPTTAIKLEKDDANNSTILDSSSVLDETINKTDTDLEKSNIELSTKNENNDNGTANLNGLEKPLTVDTTTILSTPPLTINDDIKKTVTTTATQLNIIDTIIKNELVLASTSSDKSASLSPELISEGVNVISVKQFYKKPQFLENNLGIEKDPKLGEIVQEEVVKNSTTIATTLNETRKLIVEKIEKSTIDNDVKNADDIKDLISDDSNCNKNDNESNSDSLIEGALHLDDEESTEDDESNTNKNILIKKTNEINKEEDNDDNDIDDLNTNENIIKNQQKNILIKTKDSNNKENNSSDIIKLNNLCDIKNENHNENSTAVQIVESSTNHNNKSNINIVDDDDNIKDKIQSENNNNKKTTNEKDLIKNNDKNDDKKKIIKINKNLKEEEGTGKKETNNDDKLMKSIEITTLTDNTDESNIKEVLSEKSIKSTTKSIETEKKENDLKEVDNNVNLEVIEKMEVINETENICKEIVSNKIDDDMKVEEENIVEKTNEKCEKLNSKTIESKTKETDLICNQSKQDTIDECKTSNAEQTKKLSNTTTINKRLLETPETMRQKEKHLKNLGLLTHKAAVQAKIEKQRRKKLFQTTAANKKQQQQQLAESSSANPNSAVVAGSSSNSNNNNLNLNKTQDSASTSNTSTIYSIKSGENKRKSTSGNGGNSNINNNSGRQSLKITFQKGRGRGIQNERSGNQSNQSGEEIYYTIQNENEGGQTQEAVVTHGRKSLNRNHTIDTTTITTGSSTNQSDSTIDLQNNNKKDGKQKILIPEKASSFSIHPGRLCQDQCYYCGGKFGLYDTPCHVAQLKSTERQQKILANEEKLTIDNCLCDACFRHVDKRANVPSYKKRLSAAINSIENDNNGNNSNSQQQQQLNIDNQNDNNNDEQLMETDQQYQSSFGNRSICFVPGCNNSAAHSLRKKCIRKTIKKILPNFDMSTIGGITPICSQHYDSILQYLGCALCKRRLGKNHMYHIQESEKLEVLLSENNVPVQIGNSSAICKLCRYFTNLLMKPSTGTKQNEFVRSYRRRLLQFHNVQTDDEASDDADDCDSEKLKSKRNRKLKRSETTILDEKNSESTNSSPSLIIDENPPSSDSSNPTTIVGGVSTATSGQILLDNDVLVDYDVPIISSDSPTPSPPPLLSSKLKSILQSSKNNITINNNNDKNNDITTLINNNKKEDISLVLRSNPNISMRELFPGEEEMGLHVNLPFGSSSSHRTPEGWTRVQTFLQYDEPTRRLWEDLQKPYGNQSSFLRHLILLEKYYRNGDLILTNNASSNASVYSETVQNRLRSYDNNNLININNNNNNHIASTSTITVTPINIGGGNVIQQQSGNRKNSLNNKNEKTSNRNKSDDNLKQFSNNNNNYPITITTRPKQQNLQSSTSTNNNNNSNNNKNPSNNSTSNNNNNNNLSNLIVSGNKNAIEILPILSTASLTKNNDLTITTSAGGLMTKQQKLLAAANKLIGNETAIDLKTIPSTSITATSTITNKNDQQKKNNDINNITNLSMPPELISINRQSSSSAGIIMGKQQQQQQIQQQQQRDQYQQQLQLQQQHQRIQNFEQQQQLHNKHNSSSSSSSKHGIIVLPETLSPMEQINMKNWRPTLMPITSGTHLNQSGPLYKTVDGRKLPAVVQVQSRGRPYLISIYDYNRMCILRREKLLYDQMVKNGKIKHGMRPLTVLSPKYLSSHQQQQQQQNKLKIPNKILEQNSLIPVGSGSSSSSGQRSNTTTTTNSLQQQIMSQQEQNRQQQQHQLKLRQQQQQQQQQQISLLKSSTSGGNFVPILPKLPQNHQLQILPTNNHTPMSLAASLVNNSVSIVPTISGVLSLSQGGPTNIHNTATLTSLTPSTIAGLNSTGVSMRNIMAAQKQRLDQLLLSQNYQKGNIMNSNSNNRNNSSGGGNGSNLIGGTSTSSSSVLLDNSLLSKIPKSLTVIPQQRLQSQPSQQQQGRTSAEDLTSA